MLTRQISRPQQGVAEPVDANPLKKYEEAQAKAKCMILDGVKDHVVPHIAENNTRREMWEVQTTLCQGSFIQHNMLLENQLKVAYAKRRGDRSLPSQVARDSQPVDFRGVEARSCVYG